MTPPDTSNPNLEDTLGNKTMVEKPKKGNPSVSMSFKVISKTIKDKNSVYLQAVKMPEYPGGQSTLSRYVENNLVYPTKALDDNRGGTVNIAFVTDEKGHVQDPMVQGNKLGYELD
jgi:hypothetical protein